MNREQYIIDRWRILQNKDFLKKPLKIFGLADLHFGPITNNGFSHSFNLAFLKNVSKDILNADVSLIPGDLLLYSNHFLEEGFYKQLVEFLGILSSYGKPVIVSKGNHDFSINSEVEEDL